MFRLWIYSEAKLIRFADRLHVGYERKKIKEDSQFAGLWATRRVELLFDELEKVVRGLGVWHWIFLVWDDFLIFMNREVWFWVKWSKHTVLCAPLCAAIKAYPNEWNSHMRTLEVTKIGTLENTRIWSTTKLAVNLPFPTLQCPHQDGTPLCSIWLVMSAFLFISVVNIRTGVSLDSIKYFFVCSTCLYFYVIIYSSSDFLLTRYIPSPLENE